MSLHINTTEAVLSPAVAAKPVGAPGVVTAAFGVTATTAEAAPAPALFTARSLT